MKLVKFKDGKFGVRKGFWPFYLYRDFDSPRLWWGNKSVHFRDCKTDEHTARQSLLNYGDNGEVVK